MSEKRYLKTDNAAHYLDVDPSFLKKRMGKDFIEDVHYFRSSSARLLRWDREALEAWICGTHDCVVDGNLYIVNQLLA